MICSAYRLQCALVFKGTSVLSVVFALKYWLYYTI
jgi:hypothetical protein